ncbi:MAG: efflux RND transporter permease subunit, partial [Bacteroidales bacterium]|nr:efflux RND transporter permease subunit [Bacteroidales bacterium]
MYKNNILQNPHFVYFPAHFVYFPKSALRSPLSLSENFKVIKINIIKLSIARPTVVVVTFTLFVLFGLLSYSNLSQELFPKINSSAIAVSTVYPGAGPFEVENSVTKKVEDA